jgi:hypothetical protein
MVVRHQDEAPAMLIASPPMTLAVDSWGYEWS